MADDSTKTTGKNEDLCRVLLVNAPDCDDWRENVWGAYLGPADGGHRVAMRNHSVGATFEPPDPKAPAWGDEILAVGNRGSLTFDLQRGTILAKYVPAAAEAAS